MNMASLTGLSVLDIQKYYDQAMPGFQVCPEVKAKTSDTKYLYVNFKREGFELHAPIKIRIGNHRSNNFQYGSHYLVSLRTDCTLAYNQQQLRQSVLHVQYTVDKHRPVSTKRF
jgi:hypothetical protein